MDWYLILRTPNRGTHAWKVGDEDALAVVQAKLAAVLAAYGVPDGWLDANGWDVSFAPGEPHVKMEATMHGDLPAKLTGVK